MATKKTTVSEEVLDILRVSQGRFDVCVLGMSPLILNRMSEKAKRELLLPKGRKTAFEKATTFKHFPIDEYRASAYRISDPTQPTYLAHLATAFKGAMRTAALDMPGAKKAQIGRLTYVNGDYVGIFGVPKLFMSVVRSADMNKTPDIRTRAIVPKWAARISVTYVQPLIKPQALANLIGASGITSGVGDWRSEKGAGNYGQYEIVPENDPQFLEVCAAGGREAQLKALETPECYDEDSADLLAWYDDEVRRRNLAEGKKKGPNEEAA